MHFITMILAQKVTGRSSNLNIKFLLQLLVLAGMLTQQKALTDIRFRSQKLFCFSKMKEEIINQKTNLKSFRFAVRNLKAGNTLVHRVALNLTGKFSKIILINFPKEGRNRPTHIQSGKSNIRTNRNKLTNFAKVQFTFERTLCIVN